MIKLIVAVDEKRGMANDHGIPWQGKLPTDVNYFHEKTKNHDILMGLATYNEFKNPMPDRKNYVISDIDEPLRDGFIEVRDLIEFVKNHKDDLWIIGGAGVFAQTIDLADELYITQLKGDFECTKFFPQYQQNFTVVQQSPTQEENGIEFSFKVLKRNRVVFPTSKT